MCMVYITYMYVNKRVELAQRAIALKKICVIIVTVQYELDKGWTD